MALSVITCAFFAVVMNVNYSRTQKERVKAMNLQQLEGISDELDLIYSLFAEEMLQSMHSSDYIVMTINPQYNDSTSNMRVTEELSS